MDLGQCCEAGLGVGRGAEEPAVTAAKRRGNSEL